MFSRLVLDWESACFHLCCFLVRDQLRLGQCLHIPVQKVRTTLQRHLEPDRVPNWGENLSVFAECFAGYLTDNVQNGPWTCSMFKVIFFMRMAVNSVKFSGFQRFIGWCPLHCTSARLHIECIYAVVYDEQRHQLREAIGMGEVLPFLRQYFCSSTSTEFGNWCRTSTHTRQLVIGSGQPGIILLKYLLS